MPFSYRRVIRFHETDAAGVVYFANLLTLCHEAYEASLAAAGIEVKGFFSGQGGMAVPIVHASADFLAPLHCGDVILVVLTPRQLGPHSFEVAYRVEAAASAPATGLLPSSEPERSLAVATTRHVCIGLENRRRQPLPSSLLDWLGALAVVEGGG